MVCEPDGEFWGVKENWEYIKWEVEKQLDEIDEPSERSRAGSDGPTL